MSYWLPIAGIFVGIVIGGGLGYALTSRLSRHRRSDVHPPQPLHDVFLTSVVDSLDHPFLVIDTETRIILLANAAARALGSSVGMLCNMVTLVSKVPCSALTCQCPLDTLRQTGQMVVVEQEHTGSDGVSRHIEIHAHPILDEQGHLIQMIEYVLDVTARYRMHEELTQARNDLETRVNDRTAELACANALNQLLGQAQARFIQDTDTLPAILEEMLECMLGLVGCEAGLVGETTYAENGDIHLVLLACHDGLPAHAPKEESADARPVCLKEWADQFIQEVAVGRYVGSVSDIPVKVRSTNGILLPLWRGDRIAGLVGFACSHPESCAFCVDELLLPFVTACGLLLDAHRTRLLRRSAEATVLRLAAFPQESPNPVLSLNAAGEAEYINPAAQAFMESRKIPLDLFLQKSFQEMAKKVDTDKTACCCEHEVDGMVFMWDFSPVHGTNLVHVYGQDITDRRHYEDTLRDTQERLDLALAGGDLGTWDWNVATGEVHFSQRWADMLGYRLDDLEPSLGTWKQLMHPDDHDKAWAAVQAHINGETPLFQGEFRMHKADGSVCWILSRGTVMRRDDQGRPLRMVGTHMDITSRVEAIEQLRKERANLENTVELRTAQLREYLCDIEEANRHKSRFLTSMSHEFRTPLNGILGFADLLNQQFFGPLNEKQVEYVNQINRGGQHLLALINDLLDITKIDAGRVELDYANFAPDELIKASMNMVKTDLASKKMQVVIEPWEGDINIRGDIRRCRQIMLNLLSNAVKFTPEQGTITIRIEHAHAGFLRISVSDTGMGIEEGKQDRIFSEFYQADRVRDEEMGGTGIGLALTRRLVDLHGGEIGVISEPGQGSTFWFTLPVASDSPSDQRGTAPRPAQSVADPGARILIVEDNRVNRTVLFDMLRIRHLDIATASNGQEAIEVAHTFHPDLIFMDICMPGMDGLEATRRLRADLAHRAIPIIALTASVDEDSIARCFSAGCTAHLAKPVQSAILFNTLDTYLPVDGGTSGGDIARTADGS